MQEAATIDSPLKYKRVILKLSGEVLNGGKAGDPIDAATLEKTCAQVKEIYDLGVEVCVVIGGGNIFRGLNGAERGVDRTTGDYMGMLATVIKPASNADDAAPRHCRTTSSFRIFKCICHAAPLRRLVP